MRRIAPIGAAALMLTLFTLAGGPGAIAHRDDDRDRHTCKRNPNCVATVTVRTTTTVLGDRTVTLTQTQTVAETATTTETDTTVVLELSVAKEDVGKVIGKQGRIARALRTIVKASAVRDGKRAIVEIVD